VRPLFDRRLVVVAGKGGVGRTTVSAVLGLAAAQRGLVTLVAEVDGQSDVLQALEADRAGVLDEVEISPRLYQVTIDRRAVLREYLRDEVPGPVSAAILARSRLFQLFVDAAPGLNELLTIGKVWELIQRPRHRRRARQYDLVILDAPASGQLIALLEAPETFGSIARTGPVARQAQAIQACLRDPHLTAFVSVLTPEQMPVSETVSLDGELSRVAGRRLDAIILNRLFPRRFTPAESEALARAGPDPALRSARWFAARTRAQRRQLVRLETELPHVPVCAELPFRFTERIRRDDLESLASLLEVGS
jgi:anion-transporting  ArsA/GET3 family ATPase